MQEEEDEGFGWGKSLPVPSVQEMVRIDSQSVPDRYIHETDNSPLESQVSDHESAVPVINFSLLANGDYDEQRKLDLACKEWGFFQGNTGLVDIYCTMIHWADAVLYGFVVVNRSWDNRKGVRRYAESSSCIL